MSGNPREVGYDTKAITLGYSGAVSNNFAVVPPIGLTTVYEQEDPSSYDGYIYSRKNNPTREYLEKGLALLEDAKHGLCFSSGTSAISAVVQLFNAGDHVVSADVIFGGTYRYFDKIIARLGISTTYVDASDPRNVERAIQPNTKLVFLETPTNPLLTVCDIAKIAKIVHKKKDVLFVVDNTFLTSYFQKPMNLGADIVVYSLTKYMNGHTDVCMGALCFNDDALLSRLAYMQNNAGLNPSPFDCYLVHRGLKTLPVRMRQHEKNGLKVAQFLSKHPLVKKTLYPMLPDHPQYELSKSQTSGFSGMVSFYVEGGIKDSRALMKQFRLVKMAGSLGGVETVAMVPSVFSHASMAQDTRERLGITDNLVRLSIGLEDADDIIADLDQALRATVK